MLLQATNHMATVGVVVSGVGLVSGLAGAYASLQARTILAEVRQQMAELETRIVTRINGTYVRTEVCRLKHHEHEP